MMATNNGNDTGNCKGKGIQPGSLVMFNARNPNQRVEQNPSNGKILTAVRRASTVGSTLNAQEQTDDAWVLDQPVHVWKANRQKWIKDYTGPVPSHYLIPLNDPDAEPEQEAKEKEKDKNLCEST